MTRANYRGAGEDDVAVVENSRLAARDAAGRLGEPDAQVVAVRPGGGRVRVAVGMEMTWGGYGACHGTGIAGHEPAKPPCTLSNDCLANPVMQTVSNLPGGTSEPNTVITEYAVSKYHLQPSLNGWLIQAPAPLTAAQINAARQFALAYKVPVETQAGGPSPGEIADGATALGIVIAFGVLAASVGLIRSETARDLRTLTRHRGQHHDPADDHRSDRRRPGPARRDPRHGRRGDRRAGLCARQPVRHVRRRAAE